MSESNRKTVSFEEMTYSNMLTVNALVELLNEKGIVNKAEVLQRIKELQSQVEPTKPV